MALQMASTPNMEGYTVGGYRPPQNTSLAPRPQGSSPTQTQPHNINKVGILHISMFAAVNKNYQILLKR